MNTDDMILLVQLLLRCDLRLINLYLIKEVAVVAFSESATGLPRVVLLYCSVIFIFLNSF